MNTDDHIWNLVTKKLANEASDGELIELTELLNQNPSIRNTVLLLSEWWHTDREQETGPNDYLLFQIVLGRIEDNNNLS
jgi:putative ABC transport system permease protein